MPGHAVRLIAVGRRIRKFDRLVKLYGPGRWRKLKGIARVRLSDGTSLVAEIHWYEAARIERQEFKLKRVLSD